MRTNSCNVKSQQPEHGLTRLDVVAVMGVLALLASVTLPALANTRSRSERVGCISNLRQIGQGFHAWAASHGDRMPWLTPNTEEGTFVPAGAIPPVWNGLQNVPYFQFSWISNEVVSPKYLVCPADSSKVVARSWGGMDPQGGFRHNNFQNNALSYSLFLHASPRRPTAILLADRDFGYDSLINSCFTGITPLRQIQPPATTVAWLGTVHGGDGNLLLYDGSVEQVDTAGLRRALSKFAPDPSPEHFMYPQ